MLRPKLKECANGVFGIHVDMEEAVGRIGADGQQGSLGNEATADLAETREVARVSGVIDRVRSVAENVTAEAAVRVVEDASSPMLRGRHGDFDASDFCGLPPVERANFGETERQDEVVNAVGNDGDGRPAGELPGLADDLPERGEVEVIHVGVGEQDSINGREIFDAHAGLAKAMDEDEPVGEDRVNDEIEAAELEQERGVSYECNAEFSGIDEDGLALRADGRTKRFSDELKGKAEAGARYVGGQGQSPE